MNNFENIAVFAKKIIFKKGGYTFFFRVFGMAFNFITMLFITNKFGSHDYGLFALSLTILQICAMFFSLGLPSAFISFTGAFSTQLENKSLLVKCYKIIILVCILPILVLFGFSDYLAFFFEKPELFNYLRVVFLSITFLIFHELNINYFLSIKRFDLYSAFYFVLPNLFFLLFLSLVVFFDFQHFHIISAYSLSILTTILISSFFIFIKTKITSTNVLTKEILVKSIPMMISGFFLVLLNWTDILMLGKFEKEENIGIYNAAFKVGYLALFFVMSMNAIITTDLSEKFHQKDFKGLKKLVNRSTQIVIALTLPLAIVIIVFKTSILSLFGQEFIAGSSALVLITSGALFNAMTGNVDQILNMTNHQIIVRNTMFVGFILNVIFNYLLIPKYGFEGAAFSSFIINIIVNSIFVIIIKRKLGFYTFK